MEGGIDIRVFFREGGGAGEIKGSHSRQFPVVPTVGQTIVFGRPTGAITVYRVIETGFFAFDDSASPWVLVEQDQGEHSVPPGFYDPIAKLF